MSDREKEPSDLGSFHHLHDWALKSFSQGKFAEAETHCRRALQSDSNDSGVLNLLGQALLAQKRASEAADAFSRAIRFDGMQPNLHFNLALALQAEGRLNDAIQSLRVAVKLDPSVPVLQAKLGQLLCAVGEAPEAAQVLRRALLLDAHSVPIRLNLAQALTDLGDLVETERLVRAALFLDSRDATAHRMLGRIYQLRSQFKEAAASLETSISLNPVQAAAYFSLAYSRQVSAEDRPLLATMENLVSAPQLTESDRGQLNYAIGKSFDDLKEYDAAIPYFEEANKIGLRALKAEGREFNPEFERQKVDRIIELFPSEVFSKWPEIGSDSDRPIFIVGMIRSGTTLIEQILSRHPQITAAGELSFWTNNQPRILYEILANPNATPHADLWRIGYEAELDRVSISAPHITDKMPLNFWALGLIHLAYPNAKILHCRRNSVDTCLSIFLTPFRRAPDFGHDRGNIVFAYEAYLRLMIHWRTVIPPSQVLEVDYEELVADPESNVREMIEFLGLEWDDSCLDSKLNARPVNTPSQWQVHQPVYQHSVNRWQNYAAHLGRFLELNEG